MKKCLGIKDLNTETVENKISLPVELLNLFISPNIYVEKMSDRITNRVFLIISPLIGIKYIAYIMAEGSYGDKIGLVSILLISIIFGSLLGYFLVYFWGFFLRIIDLMMGGETTRVKLMHIYVWTSIPYVLSLFITIIEIILRGNHHFSQSVLYLSEEHSIKVVFLILGLMEVFLKSWSYVLMALAFYRILSYSMITSVIVCIGVFLMHIPLGVFIMAFMHFVSLVVKTFI